ncbi:MAG: hydroxyisourate hydrolase [Betaproteobacteria bacterium]|nr:hydroxyisourate hydrolase [Betaproteobacteria bacterium]
MARLSTHVLDTAHGVPAGGVRLALHRIRDDGGNELVAERTTNQDGRTDAPLLAGAAIPTGRYRITFHAGDYFRARGVQLPDPPFVDVVELHFGIADAAGHYHVPLLVSPWSYSTYRGS